MGLRDRIATERDGTAASSGDDGVSYYRRRLLEEVDLSEFAELSAPQRRARLERVVGRMVSREGPVLSTSERTRLIRQVIDEAIGLGVLEPLLADPTVTEIMVNGLEEIFVERDGRIQRSDIAFTDEAQLYQTIDRIVSQVNRRVDESSPMVDARLPTGERVNVIIPPLALRGPTMTIRRFPRLFTLDQLTEMNSLDKPTTKLLPAVVEVRGAETLDMLQALNAGHEGSLVTVHANSPDDAIHRLETLATMSDLHIPFEALRDQINSAIHVIVQIDRFADGGRRISEVAAVASNRREPFRLATVARFETEPIGPDRDPKSTR